MSKLRYWITPRRSDKGRIVSLNIHYNFPLSKYLLVQLRELPFVGEIKLVPLVKEQIVVLTYLYIVGTTLGGEIEQISALLEEYLQTFELDLTFSNH